MSKSLKILIGCQLIENGYKMSTVNHYEKKHKNYIFCVDKDIADHLLLRLLHKNEYGKTKCVKDEFVKDLSLKNQEELMTKILENELDYKNLINNFKKNFS